MLTVYGCVVASNNPTSVEHLRADIRFTTSVGAAMFRIKQHTTGLYMYQWNNEFGKLSNETRELKGFWERNLFLVFHFIGLQKKLQGPSVTTGVGISPG